MAAPAKYIIIAFLSLGVLVGGGLGSAIAVFAVGSTNSLTAYHQLTGDHAQLSKKIGQFAKLANTCGTQNLTCIESADASFERSMFSFDRQLGTIKVPGSDQVDYRQLLFTTEAFAQQLKTMSTASASTYVADEKTLQKYGNLFDAQYAKLALELLI